MEDSQEQRISNAARMTWEQFQKEQEVQFQKELKQFKRLIKIWRDRELTIKTDSSEASLLIQYALYLHQYHNNDSLRKFIEIIPIMYKEDLKNIKEENKLFLGISFINQQLWSINFKPNANKKLHTLHKELIINIFFKIYMTSKGYFTLNSSSGNNLITYDYASSFSLTYYTQQFLNQGQILYWIISIGVHKVPYYDYNGGRLSRFDYKLMVTFEDIVQKPIFMNEKIFNSIMDAIQENYSEDPTINFHKNQLKINDKQINNKYAYFQQKKKTINRNQLTKIYPIPYHSQNLQSKNMHKNQHKYQILADQFYFRLEKLRKHNIRCEYLQNAKKNRMSASNQLSTVASQAEQFIQIEKLRLETSKNSKFQFNNHAVILENLEKIPNFKYLLTNQQRQVLCSNGNLIIVGRSGTGKTTCAMLRLYGIQMSIKMKQYNSLKKAGKISQGKCVMAYLDEFHLMKNIFLTYSSILITEIEKQYNDMLYQIRQAHAKKCHICQKTFKFDRVNDQKEDPIEKVKRQKQQQENKVISLDSISSSDFPGFFTLQNAIRIIDMSISRPFYNHQKQRKEPNNLKQHIKTAFVNRYQYSANQIKYIETVKANYVNYEFFQAQVWQKLPKQLIKMSKQYCLLTPSIVWAEIFSIIKGSLKSYLCPQGFISLKMYLQSPESIFQSENERSEQYKIRTYNIFKSYNNWCKDNGTYDLMDVVSHNLRQIQFYSYSGPKVNYMFVDEVQDLTASTTLLISKMVINNIYFSGDTAQAITKGINFKFQDLKLLFNKKYYKQALQLQAPQKIQHLTVNFRSHHLILQLANSIITAIQIIFPDNINRLSKQRSDLLGPKPFILLDKPLSLLMDLVCGSVEENEAEITMNQEIKIREMNNKNKQAPKNLFDLKTKGKQNAQAAAINEKEQPVGQQQEIIQQDEEQKQPVKQQYVDKRRFSSQQVIIVRNEQQIQKLPPSLQRGIVLTPQTAKGLEYDVIILYNFFSSCPIFSKWNTLLQHLDVIQIEEDQKSFEEHLSRRNKQERQQQQTLLNKQTKIQLGFDQKKNKYVKINLIAKESLKGITINLYHQLISQLKILYTAITRARSVFVLYDEKIPKNLRTLWEKMNLITHISKKNISTCRQTIRKYVKVDEKHVKYENEDVLWMKAGSEMLARKDFQNAKKCYLNINRMDMVQRIDAWQIEIHAQNELYRIDNEIKNICVGDKDQKKIARAKLLKKRAEVLTIYEKAINIYKRYERYNDAGDVYFKIERFQLALKYYILANNRQKMAICYKKLKRYIQALELFKQLNDIEGMIECYLESKNWIQLSKLLHEYPEYINQEQRYNIGLDCTKNVIRDIVEKQLIETKVMNQRPISKNLWSNTSSNLKLQLQKILLQHEYHYLIKLRNGLKQAKRKLKKLDLALYDVKQQQSLQDKALKNRELQLNKYMENAQSERAGLLLMIAHYAQKQQRQLYNDYKKRLDIFEAQYSQMKRIFVSKIQQQYQRISQSNKQLLEDYQQQIYRLKEKYNFENYKHNLQLLNAKIQKLENQHRIDLTFNQSCKFHTITQNIQSGGKKSDIFNVSKETSSKMLIAINRAVKLSQNCGYGACEYTNSAFHHRFIESKCKDLLTGGDISQEQIELLNKCDAIEESLACLFLCDQLGIAHYFMAKYILGCCLDYSDNFNQNRQQSYFKSKIAQEQQRLTIFVKRQSYGNIRQKFLQDLDNNILNKKLPRVVFEGMYYQQSIASQLVYGLILQGHLQFAMRFCRPEATLKLAYTCSTYSYLVDYLKEMKDYFRLPLKDQMFIFIESKRVQTQWKDLHLVNIASLQEIFFQFDQCQDLPFLNVKKQIQFDIQQQTVNNFLNQTSLQRISQMKQYKSQLESEIYNLQRDIENLQSYNENMQQQRKNYQMNYEQSIRALKRQKNQVYNQMNPMQEQLIGLEKKKVQCERQLKDAFPARQKQQYEQDIELLTLQPSTLQKFKSLFSKEEPRQQKKKRLMSEYNQKIQKEHALNLKFQVDCQKVKAKERQVNQRQWRVSQIIKKTKQLEYSMKIVLMNEIIQLSNRIQDFKKLLEYKQGLFPLLLNIKDQQQLIVQVVKILIKEQKYKRQKSYFEKKCKETKQKIMNNSSIPQQDHFSFLHFYIQGKWTRPLDERQITPISKVLIKILLNGNSLQVNENIGPRQQLSICNISMLYLCLNCNKTFQQYFDKIMKNAENHFIQNEQQRKQAVTRIQFYRSKLQQPNNYYQRSIIQQQIRNCKRMLAQLSQYPLDTDSQLHTISPKGLLNNFIDKVYQKIICQQLKSSPFIQIFFGFFLCKLTDNCQQLEFLGDEYVLANRNSIIIENLLEYKKQSHESDRFIFDFVQGGETLLCKYVDIYPIFLAFIGQKYLQLRPGQRIALQQIEKQIGSQIKHIRAQYQKRTFKEVKCDEALVDIHEFIQGSRAEYRKDLILQNIRSCKRNALRYLLQNKHEKLDCFYFASHQIQEYCLLQKMLAISSNDNYSVNCKIDFKMKMLEKEYKKYMQK